MRHSRHGSGIPPEAGRPVGQWDTRGRQGRGRFMLLRLMRRVLGLLGGDPAAQAGQGSGPAIEVVGGAHVHPLGKRRGSGD